VKIPTNRTMAQTFSRIQTAHCKVLLFDPRRQT
jgi:predicted nicotinamide N-methyase